MLNTIQMILTCVWFTLETIEHLSYRTFYFFTWFNVHCLVHWSLYGLSEVMKHIRKSIWVCWLACCCIYLTWVRYLRGCSILEKRWTLVVRADYCIYLRFFHYRELHSDLWICGHMKNHNCHCSIIDCCSLYRST